MHTIIFLPFVILTGIIMFVACETMIIKMQKIRYYKDNFYIAILSTTQSPLPVTRSNTTLLLYCQED